MQALTAGQRLLLESLRLEGRIWRSPQGYRLINPWVAGATLTADTVQAMLKAGYLKETETYGADRSLYVLSATGEMAISTKASA